MTPIPSRKAQLQSMETIIVVIMLLFLVLLGALYYAASAKDSMKKIATDARLSQLETLSKKLHYMPELSCTNYGAAKTPCIDLFKARIFGNILVTKPVQTPGMTDVEYTAVVKEFENLRLGYYSLFGDSLIKLLVLYPDAFPYDMVENITLYNASRSGDVQSRSIPVAIKNPLTGTTGLGLLYAETD